ncbi:MAG: four helix bundle protein [Ruminococcaceae bacterium]|nr:four helix bundle protein [Oscillospiraceae bacterium]
MSENKNQLREESIDFAIAVSDICEAMQGCTVYVNQLIRCSSSIGANIHEAKYAQSRADFISKLEIALKESSESEYWLELLYRKKRLTDQQYAGLKNQCGTIRRKLIASVKTAKANQ